MINRGYDSSSGIPSTTAKYVVSYKDDRSFVFIMRKMEIERKRRERCPELLKYDEKATRCLEKEHVF